MYMPGTVEDFSPFFVTKVHNEKTPQNGGRASHWPYQWGKKKKKKK